MAGINDRRSDEIWARVTTSMIQHKAVGLRPMIFGTIPPPHNLLEAVSYTHLTLPTIYSV